MRTDGPRRWPWAVALSLAVALVPAGPAAADPAAPGNVRSEVTGIVPPAPVTARVRGGDSFLELRVERGHEAVVLDYEGFDYLRFGADGTVQVNRTSRAYYINTDRYAATDAPPGLDPAGPPDWRTVASGGVYAWHDHRMHWMSPSPAPATDWTVDLRVDGAAVAVTGRYGPVAAPAGWPWWLGVALTGAAALAAAWRRVRVGALVAAGATALAGPVVVALADLPGSTWAEIALVAAAAVALAGAGWRGGPLGAALLAGAGVALALWAIRRVDVFASAVLVTELPPWLDRSAVAAALGVGVGVAVGGIRLVLQAPVAASPTAAPSPS